MHLIYVLLSANTAPSLSAPNLIRVVLNEAKMIPVNVSDADGDDVTVTVGVSIISVILLILIFCPLICIGECWCEKSSVVAPLSYQ